MESKDNGGLNFARLAVNAMKLERILAGSSVPPALRRRIGD
jgi:hypothetical protein